MLDCMLRSATHLKRHTIQATDGALGTVEDFLFDDREWIVRYLVADTGNWLPGRQVLIPPTELGQPDWKEDALPVKLTRGQVKESPSISQDEPVSRRREEALHKYYGWHPYWTGFDHAHLNAITENVREEVKGKEGDPHLRSLSEVVGYHVAATDGEIGHVEELILDDQTWHFRYIVVDTRNWLPGRKVIVSPRWAEHVSWEEKKVLFNLTREQIKESPEYDPSARVNREYETRLYDYYGRPRYWT